MAAAMKLTFGARRVHPVSRRHVEFWTNADGYWITDLDSTFGTRVHSVPLTPQ